MNPATQSRPIYIYSITPVMSTMDNGAVFTPRYMDHIVDWYYERINKLWLPERFEESMKTGLIGFCEGIRWTRTKIYFRCREPIRTLDSPFARLLIPADTDDCEIMIDGHKYKIGAVELRNETLQRIPREHQAYRTEPYANKELYHTIF